MNEEKYPLGAPEGADTPNEVPAQGATWNDAVPTQGTALNDAAPLQGAAQGSAQTAQNAPAMQEDRVPMQKDDAPVQEAVTGLHEMADKDDRKLVITTESGKIYIYNP